MQYVKNSLSPDVIVSLNEHIKRPEEIYMEAKNGLLFHCSSNRNERAVPSGVNQHTCEPIFQHHLAFKFFAIALLFVLCSSFISLLIIFALLTSKYQYKDFGKNLPWNLLFSLTSLFICGCHVVMLQLRALFDARK